MQDQRRGLIGKLERFAARHGTSALLKLPFFPLILLITNPVRLAKTIWAARVLANGRWSKYNRFRSTNGVNSLFYWTQALNFDRFGRNGVSPYVGTGQYHLGHWWFSSLTSSYLYWRMGAVLPLLSMFGWLATHAFWLDQPNVDPLTFVAMAGVALISSYFYGAAFVFLNYNALGWLFMPLGLYGLITGNYWIAALAWFGASLASLTVVVIAGWMSLALAVYSYSLSPLLALVPAAAKLATHFLYVDDLKRSLLRVASSIGLNNIKNDGVKYKRPKSGHLFGIASLYFCATWLAFTFALWSRGAHEFAILSGAAILLWIVNAAIARFADDQSIYMAMFSVATASLIVNWSPLLLAIYWIGVSPLPLLIGAGSDRGSPLSEKSYRPFDVGSLIERASRFFSRVPKESRVLLALSNPNGDYIRIFDGYRVIYELAFYVGNLKRILVFPDWWAVFENNTTSSPEFWGREPSEVLNNVEAWRADHVLIYQDSCTELESKWKEAGFVELDSMDWGSMVEDYLAGEPCWGADRLPPKWFLLRVPVARGAT